MPSRRARLAGFTLVEVLVGTALLGIMMTLLMSALFVQTRSARAGEMRLEETDAMRLTQGFLRRQVSEAIPLTDRSADGTSRQRFAGSTDSLLFVGRLPAHRGGGGLHYIRLYFDDTGSALTMDHQPAWPWVSVTDALRSAPAETTILVDAVSRAHLSYFGRTSDEAPARWTNVWEAFDRLPQLVKLEIELTGGERWPALVMPIRTQTAAGQPHLFVLEDGSEGS